MPDERDEGHEDILTGRRRPPGGKRRARRDEPGATQGENTGPGRSRRRFTVDALFSDTRPQAIGVDDLTEAKHIRLDRIVPDPDQPRRTFDEARLEELEASIAREGVLQPIVVRYDPGSDIYVIVHGERRYRASRRAGLERIPALVRDVPEERRLIQQLMENVVRDDLNPVDRARALRMLKSQMHDAPWEEVASAVGIRRSRLFQLLDTTRLPASTQERIRAGDLSEKQSRALQGLPAVYQETLGAAIIDRAVPGPIAQRVGRAIRQSRRQVQDAGQAAAHVAELIDLAFAAGEQGRAAQADRLLALLGPDDVNEDGYALEEVATALGAPRFSADRVTRSVADLAQSLAWAGKVEIASDQDLQHRLARIRDVLNRLLDT